MKDLIIIGAGGHGKVVIEAAELQGEYRINGVVDEGDNAPQKILGYPVRKSIDDFTRAYFIVAIGNNKIRKQKFEQLLGAGWEPATVIHPSAWISKYASIGAGTMICLRASLCTEAVLGENVIINTGSTIPHESLIGAHAHVSSGCHLGGQTTVGEGSLLGVGCSTRPLTRIGAWATVGAGSVIVSNVPDFKTYAGVPAKQLNVPANQIDAAN